MKLFSGMFQKAGAKIIYLFVLIALIVGGWLFMTRNANQTKINSTVVSAKLEAAKELTTAKYIYTDVEEYNNTQKLFGTLDIPFLTSKHLMISFNGIIHAGIDLKDIKVDAHGKNIAIQLPKPKILSHELDEESIKYYDQSSGLFNPITIEDSTKAKKELKENIEEKAIENGLLTEATESAKKSITELLTFDDTIKQEYTITFP
ncbi:DUF4230 domain-containing protein [Streptococcus himalayensis]|uniref:DUF4230 domain-containing protein n=1 Tax=Streptococcus himalayensis TaxID=1888195 RepID=A0A917A9E4_9STRE|nr:DUF4230 domain-containing protein [Streptococcus himalayensis]GGE32957.1 hypothetical protein GCM10011510_12890 [Streptococcus himalayensis]